LGDSTPHEELTGAVGALTSDYKAAVAAIESMSDTQEAVQSATELVQALRTAYDGATKLRNQLALRIFETEALSLARLADRISVSKARADQIVRAAKADQEEK